jgi:hypothetical protein
LNPTAPADTQSADAQDTLDLVLFRCGGLALAVPAAQVLGMTADRAPDTRSIAELLGLPSPPTATGNGPCLRIADRQGPRTLSVEAPVVHCRLAARDLRRLPVAVTARLRLPCVRALARSDSPEGPTIAIVLDLALAFMAPPANR